MSHRQVKRARRAARTAFITAVSLDLLVIANPTVAQDAAEAPVETLDEITVTGIRAAQQRAIDIKRNASQIVDSISAEDIGKLPDVTISDSLQRVPGVQIRREAGEGSAVNVRGLPQVTTLLNDEQYLGANSITTVQPNFGDIPSQLFAGVDVIKSPTADLLNGGVTGTVNLKTRRPFDLSEGVSASFAAEAAYGDSKSEFEPQANGLVGWRNDTFGALVSVSYGDVTQANYYNGLQGDSGWTGRPNEGANWPAAGDDINGDGDATDAFISYQGHAAFNKFTERERLGVNASFQAQMSETVRLTFDAFFTDQTQFDRTAGFAAEDKWQRWEWWTPTQSTPTGAFVGSNEIQTTQEYLLDTRRLKSYSDLRRTDSTSQNFNLQVDFGSGDDFSGSVRAMKATAEQNRVNSYADIDLSNGSQWGIQGNYYPGGTQNPYPNGYAGFPQISVDYTGEHVGFSGFPAEVGELDAYSIGALSSENNFDRDADLNVLRADISYQFNDAWSVDAGVRASEREAENLAYDYLAPFYAAQSSTGEGCLVKWKATDVVLNGGGIAGACTAGDGGGNYTALGPLPLSSFGDDVILVTDFGPASGVPAFYSLDPAAMDNPLAFHNELFPGNVKVANPGQSFLVNVDQTTAYLQGNFKGEDFPLSANFGLRMIKTKLDVTQNNVGAPQPYGASNADGGDTVTRREFNDYLPTLNVAYDLTDDLKLRGAFAKTMTMLDLQQWGGALAPSYAISNEEGGRFIVIGANSDGNPALNPWRSKNFDLSLEWYPMDQTLVNLALFYVEIASFIERGTVLTPLPDQDGVIRRSVNVNTNVQGEGGHLKGAEVGVKHSFTHLPGVWRNFGLDANYTYSPSNSGKKDLAGDTVPFQDNSVHQANLALWYQGEKLQARIAHNYRSKRAVALDQVWGTAGLTLYQEATNYVDASVSYDINPDLTVYLQGSNLTNEYEDYFFQWGNQYANQNIYERRLLLGVRARFGAARR